MNKMQEGRHLKTESQGRKNNGNETEGRRLGWKSTKHLVCRRQKDFWRPIPENVLGQGLAVKKIKSLKTVNHKSAQKWKVTPQKFPRHKSNKVSRYSKKKYENKCKNEEANHKPRNQGHTNNSLPQVTLETLTVGFSILPPQPS